MLVKGMVCVVALAACAAREPRGAGYEPTPSTVIAAVDERVDPPKPDDRSGALRAARALIERGRAEGDPRYLGRAQAVLAAWWDDDGDDAVVLLRATIRQALHDFAAARRDLDMLIERRPDDLQARLTRATVATVTGDVAQARLDCAALAPRAGELIAASCAAPLAWQGDDLDAAYARLHDALDAAPTATSAIRAWAEAAAGELASLRGDPAAAEAHLRAALVAAPGDPYALGALADLLLDLDRPGEVVAMLASGSDADPLLLRLAIAGRRAGTPGAERWADTLRARLAASVKRGDRTHLREHARFARDVDGDTRAAFAMAIENWALQREHADARLVADTAGAIVGARP